MKRIKVVALLLACAMLLGGCSLVSIDKDRVADLVVAQVNDTKIYKYEINESTVQNYVYYQVSMMEQYGYSYTDEEIEEMLTEQREASLESRVQAEVLLQKAEELGITLTEDEKAENMKDAQDSLDSILDYFIGEVEDEILAAEEEETADDLTDDTADDTADATDDAANDTEEVETDPAVLAEAQTRYDEYVEENNITLDSEYEDFCEQDIISKVEDYAMGFANVTEEDAKTWYDQTLVLQQEEMDAASGVFEEKISGNKIYTYIPERIVAVRDILVAFDDTLASDLKTAYDEVSSNYDTLLSAAVSNYSDLLDIAEEIKTKLEDGEEPADIVEEMSAEEESISDDTPDYGYLIDPRTTDYSENYVSVATGLETVGEVSSTFADYDGVHVLVLMNVYEPGIIPFEDLRDSIIQALQPSAEEDMYNEMVEQWMDEANIKYYYKRLNSYNDL